MSQTKQDYKMENVDNSQLNPYLIKEAFIFKLYFLRC